MEKETTTPTPLEAIKELVDALERAEGHLDYCGYGDAWERECALQEGLRGIIGTALKRGRSCLENLPDSKIDWKDVNK